MEVPELAIPSRDGLLPVPLIPPMDSDSPASHNTRRVDGQALLARGRKDERITGRSLELDYSSPVLRTILGFILTSLKNTY